MRSERTSTSTRYRLELVEKVVDVLTAFTPTDRGLTLAEITQRTQQSESSVYRIVANLTELGLLERDKETRRFRIGIRAYAIGSLAIHNLSGAARPRLERLCELHGLTVNLSVRDGADVLLIDVVESRQPLRLSSSVGSREPWHCTAAGKCLVGFASERHRKELLETIAPIARFSAKTLTSCESLSTELARVRRTVVALDRGEYQAQARCLAVPIFGGSGDVCAAVSVSGPRELFSASAALPIASQLLAVGSELSAELGASGGYPVSSLGVAPRGATTMSHPR